MNIEILKERFGKNRLNFINLGGELINHIHNEINLILVTDKLSPFGGQSWLYQNRLTNPTRFVIVEIYANGEVVIKFRNENNRNDNEFLGSDSHFFIYVEKADELLKNAIDAIKKHCTVDYSSKLDIKIEEFISQSLYGSVRIKNCLRASGFFNKDSTIKDLLNIETKCWSRMRNLGIGSWKNLMQGLYDFGIIDCFDYPIAKSPEKYRLTERFITECRKEIVGEQPPFIKG